MFLTVVLAALATLSMTTLIVPALLPVARRFGLLDRPGGRRKHDKPVPAIGGLAILFALVPGVLWFLPMTPQLKGLGVAVTILCVAGLADDILRLRWQYRLAAQVSAALAMVWLAELRIDNVGEIFGFATRPLGPLATPLTVLAAVGIVNAVNMADGVDGLAGVLGLVVTTLLAGAATYSGDANLAIGLGLVAGGLCGFLVYNMRTPWNPRARIFLGNTGSELLGLLIACGAFRLTQNAAHPVGVQIAPFLMAPILIDCLVLMTRRVRSGASPFAGDRNHLHHLLLDAGMTPTRVVMTISAVTLSIGLAAAFAAKADVPPPVFTTSFVMMCAGYFLATNDRDRFVEQLRTFGLKAGWVKPEKPLEPWQIEARAAGRYWRRASDRPADLDAAPSAEAAISRAEQANAATEQTEALPKSTSASNDQATSRALMDSRSSK